MITELSKKLGELLEELVQSSISPGFSLCTKSLGFKTALWKVGEGNSKTSIKQKILGLMSWNLCVQSQSLSSLINKAGRICDLNLNF